MKRLSVFVLTLILLAGCFTHKTNEPDKPLVVVSKNYGNKFTDWLKKADTNIIVKQAYGIKDDDSLFELLKQANGIIISGGEDINPALYGKDTLINLCGKINNYRDSLEIKMINFAFKNGIPLLGICRGHQLLNVAFGGSLIVDIPTKIPGDTLHRNNGRTFHKVSLDTNSLIFSIIRQKTGTVYSNHHQAVEKTGKHLKIVAFAPDGIVEATELYDTLLHKFVLSVQWHPELMTDTNPFNYKLRNYFVKKVLQNFNGAK